jgi:hypothetical protein
MSLANQIIVNANYTRSVNLERDCDSPTIVRGYIPTPRALHTTLGRIADTLAEEVAPRAWSLVGPYGTGKSSFAAFLTHLVGAPNANNTRAALDVLDAAEPSLAQRFGLGRDNEPEHRGHCVAVLTGSPEPFGKRLALALAEGATRYWAERTGRRPDVIEVLHRLGDAEQVTTSDLTEAISSRLIARSDPSKAGQRSQRCFHS